VIYISRFELISNWSVNQLSRSVWPIRISHSVEIYPQLMTDWLTYWPLWEHLICHFRPEIQCLFVWHINKGLGDFHKSISTSCTKWEEVEAPSHISFLDLCWIMWLLRGFGASLWHGGNRSCIQCWYFTMQVNILFIGCNYCYSYSFELYSSPCIGPGSWDNRRQITRILSFFITKRKKYLLKHLQSNFTQCPSS
jgi:hypothetical protein